MLSSATRSSKCNADEGANLVEFSLGKDTYAYRSITPEKRVDTVRAYALVGEHRIVQVTVLGLNEHSAPDRIRVPAGEGRPEGELIRLRGSRRRCRTR